MRAILIIYFALLFYQLESQINIVPNSGFELHSLCPSGGAQWNLCAGWNNVNGNAGVGAWGTPDYFNTCGIGGAVPPATFAGTCNPQSGNAMMALVLFNVPYPNYREYLSTQLSCSMLPGNTYTLSFWLSNGTGIKSPWTIKNIGAHFSSAPLSQSGWGLINVIPQCEIANNVVSSGWSQFTFTINPTSTWNYITIGAFKSDLLNNPVMSFPNPGGAPSSYANYFVDNVQVFSTGISPSFSLIPSVAQATCGGTASATVASSNPNLTLSYLWSPGNYTTASVSGLSLGVYTVTAISGNSCAVSSASVQLTINPSNILTPTINTNGNINCTNPSRLLSALPNATTNTFFWSGPGIVGSPSVPNVVVNAAGIYSVTITNTTNLCNGTKTINVISTIAPLTLGINPSSNYRCLPSAPLVLTASGANAYTWSPGASVFPPLGPLVTANPTLTTTYTLSGATGVCLGTALITISVNSTPILITSATNFTLCSGVTKTVTVSGAGTYSWSPGNYSGAVFTLNPVSTQIYTVSGFNGNCAASKQVTASVIPLPAVFINASSPSVCAGSSATLSASGASTYTWQTVNSTNNSIVVTPSASTNYTVSATSAQGCKANANSLVNVVVNPNVTAVIASSLFCFGGSVSITASGASNYTWMPINQTGSFVVAAPNSNITYTLIGESLGCKSATTLSLAMIDCSKAVIGVSNAVDKPSLINGNYYKLTFTVLAVNPSPFNLSDVLLNNYLKTTFIHPCTYTVVSPPNVISQNSNLSANPNFDGDIHPNLTLPASSSLAVGKTDTLVFSLLLDPKGFYGLLKNSVIGSAQVLTSLKVADSSNTGFVWDPDNDGNPTNNNLVTLINIEEITLFIPEGFTPNGDGKNDTFVIKGLNDKTVKLTIFNRWGNKVYENNAYDNSWDGHPNVNSFAIGKNKLPQSTYYYLIEFLDGNKETATGFVVLQY